MKHLKLYEDYNNSGFITNFDEVVHWIKSNWYGDPLYDEFDPSKLTKNSNGTFDYDESVILGGKDKKIDRIAVEFNYVGGWFNCAYNSLATLEGSPRHVEGSFWCAYNNLATLEGSPRHVGGNFDCSCNNLVTLEDSPRHVGGWFNCNYNMLTTKDSKYSLGFGNPSYKETDLTKIANKFLDKLKTEKKCKGHEGRILKALKQFKPEVYEAVMDVADLDTKYWLDNLNKSDKHKDILDL